jgi:hypothetical protein
MPLPLTHLIDELATAYVQAIAAAAGATIAVGRDYGVDGILKHIVKTDDEGYVESGHPVEFQLKGTTQVIDDGHVIKFDLRARNYNLIVRRSETETPCFLFLVRFGADSENWMTVEPERLILNASGFWWKHSGVRTTNTSSVRIEIPVGNHLTSVAMVEMLRDSRERFRA